MGFASLNTILLANCLRISVCRVTVETRRFRRRGSLSLRGSDIGSPGMGETHQLSVKAEAEAFMRLIKTNFGLSAGLFLVALFIQFSFLPGDLLAQAPFYQGKTITILQGTAPGGTSDMMVKAAIPYLKKYIPGEPTLVSEYMPGGGGMKATNHIYKNVRPDGLTVGNLGGGLIANAVLGEPGVLYDINKLIYLGSPHSTYHWVFMTRRESGLVSLEALRSAAGVRVGLNPSAIPCTSSAGSSRI